MRHFSAEIATLLWLFGVALMISWLSQSWSMIGWALALVISTRWLLALWAADKWLSSGGRRLSVLWSGPLSDFLYSVTRLLERERNQSHKLLGRARYFKHAAEALPEGVIAIDGSSRIAWFNQGAIALLGLRRRNRGQIVSSVLRLPDVLALVAGQHKGALEILSPVDATRMLELELTPFLQGHNLLIVRDITSFKRSDAIRRDFVANASHELRTPLTVMQGYVEMMLDTPSSHADYWHKPLEQMHNQSERMRKIVEDMLVLSALEGSDTKLKQETVNVPILLAQIVDEALQLSGKRAHVIRLVCDSDKGLIGHEEYLRSAFTNLVSNAVRYTPDGGIIGVRWWQDGQGAHLSVIDTGIGIAPEHLPRIMERFYRVDSARSRATGGTGLGLAITKHVLERHHAHLTIESDVGIGSCFSCHFPQEAMCDIEKLS
jgi:two-component system phosphate regulon sensor histidine kinase PhoR